METTEMIEQTEQAVEQNPNVALIVLTYTAAAALIGVAGYKIGGFAKEKLAARKAAKIAKESHTETPEEN